MSKPIPVAIQRLIDEVRAEHAAGCDDYNRMHNRHNRSLHNRSLEPPPQPPPIEPPLPE